MVDFIISIGCSTAVGLVESGQGGAGGKRGLLVNVVAVLVINNQDFGRFSVISSNWCVEMFIFAESQRFLSTISKWLFKYLCRPRVLKFP